MIVDYKKINAQILYIISQIPDLNSPQIFYIDLFSGAGGTTTGIHMVGSGARAVGCVNHDNNAINSHHSNHKNCLHFIEDVRDWHVVVALRQLVEELRKRFPGCIIALWASLECTNYSKAKGGLPRDADSRTLAHALYMYIEELQPDYIDIENVREFMSWGPLDENGKPISRLNGRDYLRWIKKIKSYGYNYDKQMLNAADFGAFTSRERYFGQFAKYGLPIVWPEATHSKKPVQNGLFASLKKWKAVKEVLDLSDEGTSIFTRKKPLSENTLKRIYAGLVKFVAGGDDAFIQKYFSGRPMGKVIPLSGPSGTIKTIDSHAPVFIKRYNGGNPAEKVKSVENPIGSISTSNRHALVKPCFLTAHYSSGANIHSLDKPCPTVSTKDRFTKVQPTFMLDYQYKSNAHSINKPAPTLVTKDKFATVQPKFITNYYNGGGQLSSIENPNPTVTGVPKQRLTSVLFMDQQFGNSKPHAIDRPAGTVTANPKQNLVAVQPWIMNTNFNNVGSSINKPAPVVTANRKWHYLLNPQYDNKGNSIDRPCFTLIARMDKKPPHIVSTEQSKIFAIPFFEHENESMKRIRLFMAIHGIIDIKMRMLKIPELLRIQGFPANYVLKGTQTEQKKYIGNAVVPQVAKAIISCRVKAVNQLKREAV
ncbi:DNA cytosine methyltransferase [Prolixibacteraceae bacterium Z1-6]|uniref:DNA (cytosine-5-)-methyltransferase n=1 Tax=Draconibacterium aestuarii TaxID=2998507 RepID=A0A9X3F409_9BACT|nr:DNA cytosine methyltransferase [Prolixibacteraceae bacterium Z1-6]